jgi:predicted nucleic acid-binding protein
VKALYLDASAFVKTVMTEPESGALRAFLALRPERRVSSALLRTEALRAVRHLGPGAMATVREGLRDVDLVAIDDRVLDAAGVLGPQTLRTLDAIHVATALAIGDDLADIVTYDERMVEAGRSLGLSTTVPR